jgi:ubiquinone biosynthesis accessory factor UbiJ
MFADLIGQSTTKALLAVFNRVLAQHQWARDKLGMHAGRTVLLGLDLQHLPKLPLLPPPEILVLVSKDGFLETASATNLDKPSVEMRVKPSFEAMSALGKEGPQGLLRHMKIEGDVLLAAALGEIASQARWDFEDDISKVLGDVPARRIGRLVEDSKFALQDGRQVAKGRFESLRGKPDFPLPDSAALAAMDRKLEELSRRVGQVAERLGR